MGPVRSDHCLRRVLTGVAQPPGEGRGLGGRLAPGLPRPVRRGAARPPSGACGEGCAVGAGGGDAAATAAAGGGLTGPVQASVHRPATGAAFPEQVLARRARSFLAAPRHAVLALTAGTAWSWGGVASAPRWSGTPGKGRRCSRRAAGPETAARPRPALGRPCGAAGVCPACQRRTSQSTAGSSPAADLCGGGGVGLPSLAGVRAGAASPGSDRCGKGAGGRGAGRCAGARSGVC